MKRGLLLALVVALLITLLPWPSITHAEPDNTPRETISIVSTIFPGYDFARAVAGDRAELKMLLPPGAESHSFEPTPQDIIAIQNCDLFLYVGGDSDSWVDGILDSMDTDDMKILSMMEIVDPVTEEITKGMEDDHGHDHSHSEPLDPDTIKNRPLSDWAGTWRSIETAMGNGALDEYIAHVAEENSLSKDAQQTAFAARWASDYPSISIEESSISFGDMKATYRPIGYRIVEGDHGAAVWYGFEIEERAENAPRFIAFSDHGTGEQEEHDDHTHSEEVAHFHFRYGDEPFDALVAIEDWAPTYFSADATDDQIAQAMDAHGQAEEEAEYDEHVWTSPVNAMRIVQAIAQKLSEIDAPNADQYRENAEMYCAQLEQLDRAFEEIAEAATRRTLIFGDRFPFRYFVDEYGLEYFAAFPGCSTETEASARTVAFLIDKVIDESIPVVFHIEFSNEKMADTICEATGAQKRLLHSCHNVTKGEMEAGATYLSLMSQNIETLKEALS